MLAFTPAVAHGGPLKPTSPQRVTGDTPLPRAVDPPDPAACGSPRDHQGWENQPLVAVNPTDPDHLVATWIQDWNDATLVGYSTDAGRNWATAMPLTTECTWRMANRDNDPAFSRYDDHDSVNDPAVAFGPDGIAYLTSAVFGSDPGYVVAHRSIDGGRSWSDPLELDVASPASTGTGVDYTNVAADPVRPRIAYALWENASPLGDRREQYVARTTDGGLTWSTKARVPTPDFPGFGQLAVLPDGSVLDIYIEIPPQPGLLPYKLVGPSPLLTSPFTGPTNLYVSRSQDGSTWSQPTLITVADPKRLATPRVAAAPDGTVYVFWLRAESSTRFSLQFTSSADGGKAWSDPQQAGPPIDRASTGSNGLLSQPNIAVATDGTLGVTFYDHRRDPGNNPPADTDYWFRHSHDRGVTWTEKLLAGPFNKSSAPDGGPPPGGTDFEGAGNLGEAQGIAPIGNGFGTLFALAQPLDGANFELASAREPTDLFFIRLKTLGRTG